MTQFKKGVKVNQTLPKNYPVIESFIPVEDDGGELNKHNIAELESVLDKVIGVNPKWMAKLEQIVKDNK